MSLLDNKTYQQLLKFKLSGSAVRVKQTSKRTDGYSIIPCLMQKLFHPWHSLLPPERWLIRIRRLRVEDAAVIFPKLWEKTRLRNERRIGNVKVNRFCDTNVNHGRPARIVYYPGVVNTWSMSVSGPYLCMFVSK